MTTIQTLQMLKVGWVPAISVEANLRKQVKRSGRNQKSPMQRFETPIEAFRSVVAMRANLRSQVKRSGRNQNRRLQKGLPA